MVSKQPGPPPGRRQPQQLSTGKKWGCGCASAVAFLLLLGACGAIVGDDDPAPKPSATPSASKDPTPSGTASATSTPSDTAQNAVEDDDHDVTRHHKKKRRAPTPYYRSCSDAQAAGAAPLHAGEPGYRLGLDRDHDGTACDT